MILLWNRRRMFVQICWVLCSKFFVKMQILCSFETSVTIY